MVDTCSPSDSVTATVKNSAVQFFFSKVEGVYVVNVQADLA